MEAAGEVGRRTIALIAVARPEEAPQPVAEMAGNHVEVHVGHALADDLVQGEKGPFGTERDSLRCRDAPADVEEGGEKVGREVGERAVVLFRHHEDVAVEDGEVVQEGDDVALVQDDVSSELAVYDPVEYAVFRESEVTPFHDRL